MNNHKETATGLLTRFVHALLDGDADDRARLLDTAKAIQDDPAWYATHAARDADSWAVMDGDDMIAVTLWEGQLTVDLFAVEREDDTDPSGPLVDLDDLDLSASDRARVSRALAEGSGDTDLMVAQALHEKAGALGELASQMRDQRDESIRQMISAGRSMYSIAKTLGISESAVRKIRDAG